MSKKLGIVIDKNFYDRMYLNGINLNTLVWYEMFEKCGYDTYFLLRHDNLLNDFNYKVITYNYNSQIDIKLDYIFTISVFDDKLLNMLNDTKKIYICLGNELVFIIWNSISNLDNTLNYFNYDEVWISPHFEYSKFFYEIFWNTNVYICPYIWNNNVIKNNNIIDNNDNFNELNIAIVEPNINPKKNCIIPICICEKSIDYINHVYVFNTKEKIKNTELIDFIKRTNLFKYNKISFEGRLKILDIIDTYCNCVISFTENWDLNYVHLECFYLGIPIIHNSKMLKNFGYYYPDYDIDTAVKNIKFILKNHNKYDYILRHKDILNKYSIDNKLNKSWVINRLENKYFLDFQ